MGVSGSSWGYPFVAGCFISWKIPSFEMDELVIPPGRNYPLVGGLVAIFYFPRNIGLLSSSTNSYFSEGFKHVQTINQHNQTKWSISRWDFPVHNNHPDRHGDPPHFPIWNPPWVVLDAPWATSLTPNKNWTADSADFFCPFPLWINMNKRRSTRKKFKGHFRLVHFLWFTRCFP